jgi:inner membrane transporter RhtA
MTITTARDRQRAVAGAVMIVGTSLAIQLAGGLAHGIFPALSPPGVSALRFFLGAVILLPAVRPALRGRSRATWLAVGGYGASLAALNLSYFEAIDRIPLGLAVTLGFLPPLVMAAALSRRLLDLAWVAVAAGGVLALEGTDPPRSTSGVLLAIASGIAWLGVAYAGRALGQVTRRADGLALALPVAAVITLPFGLARISHLDGHVLGVGLVIAIGGLVVPFTLELEALRRLEPRTVAVIYSIDPVNGALVGLFLLGQQPTAVQIVAMTAIVSASTGATLTAKPATTQRSTPDEDQQPPGRP